MPDVVLEHVIRTYMQTDQETYIFTWQGGEPLLMGLEFYKKIIGFQSQYGRKGARVANGVQTNATLINAKSSRFFRKYQFLLGCSLDGPAWIHNQYRRNRHNQPSHQLVLKGLEHLKKNSAQFNILVLVTQANVHAAGVIYDYLVKQGFCYQQYIPCVEFDKNGALCDFAITGEEWGRFICQIFEKWQAHDIFSVSIRNFDSILSKIVDNNTDICAMSDTCCQYLVVEHNGDVYPCDFFVRPQYRMGNIMSDSWQDLLTSDVYRNFGAQKSDVNNACKKCSYLYLCNGDCLKHRIYNNHQSDNKSWLCDGWDHFFEFALGRFEQIADKIRACRRQSLSKLIR